MSVRRCAPAIPGFLKQVADSGGRLVSQRRRQLEPFPDALASAMGCRTQNNQPGRFEEPQELDAAKDMGTKTATPRLDFVQPRTLPGVFRRYDVDDGDPPLRPGDPRELTQYRERAGKIRECVRAGHEIKGSGGVGEGLDVTQGREDRPSTMLAADQFQHARRNIESKGSGTTPSHCPRQGAGSAGGVKDRLMRPQPYPIGKLPGLVRRLSGVISSVQTCQPIELSWNAPAAVERCHRCSSQTRSRTEDGTAQGHITRKRPFRSTTKRARSDRRLFSSGAPGKS